MARKKKSGRTKTAKKSASLAKVTAIMASAKKTAKHLKHIQKRTPHERVRLAALRDRYSPAERKQIEREREEDPKHVPMTVMKKRVGIMLSKIREHGG